MLWESGYKLSVLLGGPILASRHMFAKFGPPRGTIFGKEGPILAAKIGLGGPLLANLKSVRVEQFWAGGNDFGVTVHPLHVVV